MNEDLKQTQREQLSALVDGQLAPENIASALAFAGSDEGRQTWQLYQLVGEVLRSPDVAHHAQHDVLPAVRTQLAKESRQGLQPPPHRPVAVSQVSTDPAANSAVFRWKLVAGLASMVAVSVLVWGSWVDSRSGSAGVQLAKSAAQQQSEPAAVDGTQLMLRDPRLDELLAEHRQYSPVSALPMPANFLRNANFSALQP